MILDIIGSSPTYLFTSVWATAHRIGLFTITEIIGNVLLLYFITSQALAAATSGRGSELSALFVRAVIAAALLTGAGFLQQQMSSAWLGVWGTSKHLAQQVQATSSENLVEGLRGFLGLEGATKVVGAIDFIMENDKALTGGVEAGVAGVLAVPQLRQAAKPLMRIGLQWLARGFRLLSIPIVVLFLVITFSSGLIITLIAALIPIAAAMMASGGGSKMFQMMVTKAIGSYAMLLAIPIAMSALLEMALFAPLVSILQQTGTAVENLSDIFNINWDEDKGWFGRLLDAAGQVLRNVGETIDSIFMIAIRAVAMVIGGIIGAFMVMNSLEGYIHDLVGGIASGGKANRGDEVGVGSDLKKNTAKTLKEESGKAGRATVQGVKNLDNKLAQGSIRAADAKARGFSEPTGGGRSVVHIGPQSRQNTIERLRNEVNS